MELTRRSLLLTAAALPAVSVARKNTMKFGFTSYLWGREWDIPTLIANCRQLKAYGVELRVEMKAAHGVELTLDSAQRAEVRKQFTASPVRVLGLATGERFDFVDSDKLAASLEKAKRYAQLSHDIGGTGIRVFPNDFHKEVPQEKTIEQIARGLNQLARSTAGLGQTLRLENHGSAGRLTTLKRILDQVDQPNVCVKLNSDAKDAADGAFEANFNLVKDRLGDTLHMHDLTDTAFPYQLQCDLLMKAGWTGWWLPELDNPPAMELRMAGLQQQRRLWDALIEKSLAL